MTSGEKAKYLKILAGLISKAYQCVMWKSNGLTVSRRGKSLLDPRSGFLMKKSPNSFPDEGSSLSVPFVRAPDWYEGRTPKCRSGVDDPRERQTL
jgi:hypothetical protein